MQFMNRAKDRLWSFRRCADNYDTFKTLDCKSTTMARIDFDIQFVERRKNHTNDIFDKILSFAKRTQSAEFFECTANESH